MWLQRTGKAVQGEELHRVSGARVISQSGKEAQGGGEGKIELLEANGDFTRENGAGGSAEDANVARLVGFEEIFVDGDDIVDSGRKGMFWGEAVVDGDHFDFGEIPDGDAFDERAGVGIEAAAVKINKDETAICRGSFERRNDIRWNAGRGGRFDVHGEEPLGFSGLAHAPLVSVLAACGEVFGAGGRLREGGEPFLRFGADGRGHRDDAGEVRGAVGIDGGGVLGRKDNRRVLSA